jgi:hypothetical protein
MCNKWCDVLRISWVLQHLGREVKPHIKPLAVDRRRSTTFPSLTYYDLFTNDVANVITMWTEGLQDDSWLEVLRILMALFNCLILSVNKLQMLVQYLWDKVDSRLRLRYFVRILLHWFTQTCERYLICRESSKLLWNVRFPLLDKYQP